MCQNFQCYASAIIALTALVIALKIADIIRTCRSIDSDSLRPPK